MGIPHSFIFAFTVFLTWNSFPAICLVKATFKKAPLAALSQVSSADSSSSSRTLKVGVLQSSAPGPLAISEGSSFQYSVLVISDGNF